MAGERTTGPLGLHDMACWMDDGTSVLQRSSAPGPLGMVTDSVASMPLEDRFVEVLQLTVPKLPDEIRAEFAAMLTATNLAIMAGVLAVWGASHYFGVGFVIDALLLVSGVVVLGWQVWVAAKDLMAAVEGTVSATSRSDLDEAARHLADFVALVGVATFMALLLKGGKRLASGRRAVLSSAAASRKVGMPSRHIEAFRKAAGKLNRIIVVRGTNPKSLQWIRRGFPPKPKAIAIKTSKSTGIVTALNEMETQDALRKGYYVVDQSGVPRNVHKEALGLGRKPEWPVEKGQVIDPTQKKPLVGDYDLQGVIDPNAPGRNIVLATSKGKNVDNLMSPDVKKVLDAVNPHFDQPRVLHGADDQFLWNKVKDPLPTDDVLIVFHPDETFRVIDDLDEARAFYRSLGRQTIHGKYQ